MTARTRRHKVMLIAWIAIGVLAIIGFNAYQAYSLRGFATYDFRLQVYSHRPWEVTYQGYEGGPQRTVASHANYTGGGNVTLIAPVYGNLQKYGLYICAWATDYWGWGGNLTVSLYAGSDNPIATNSTYAVNGTAEVCGGVAPGTMPYSTTTAQLPGAP